MIYYGNKPLSKPPELKQKICFSHILMSLSKVDVGERVSEESKYLITKVAQVTIIKGVPSLQCFHVMGGQHDSP